MTSKDRLVYHKKQINLPKKAKIDITARYKNEKHLPEELLDNWPAPALSSSHLKTKFAEWAIPYIHFLHDRILAYEPEDQSDSDSSSDDDDNKPDIEVIDVTVDDSAGVDDITKAIEKTMIDDEEEEKSKTTAPVKKDKKGTDTLKKDKKKDDEPKKEKKDKKKKKKRSKKVINVIRKTSKKDKKDDDGFSEKDPKADGSFH